MKSVLLKIQNRWRNALDGAQTPKHRCEIILRFIIFVIYVGFFACFTWMYCTCIHRGFLLHYNVLFKIYLILVRKFQSVHRSRVGPSQVENPTFSCWTSHGWDEKWNILWSGVVWFGFLWVFFLLFPNQGIPKTSALKSQRKVNFTISPKIRTVSSV